MSTPSIPALQERSITAEKPKEGESENGILQVADSIICQPQHVQFSSQGACEGGNIPTFLATIGKL